MRTIDADRLKEVFNRNVVSAGVWNEIIDAQPTVENNKMWLIETKNTFSMFIENYLICAETEYDAKIKFSLEFPSFKVRSIVNKSEEVIKLK